MEEIILYSNHCPQCRVLEAKLKQKGISYEEETNIQLMTEKGFMSVPMLEVDGIVMNFTEANTWINERN
jgi:glutaredoxin